MRRENERKERESRRAATSDAQNREKEKKRGDAPGHPPKDAGAREKDRKRPSELPEQREAKRPHVDKTAQGADGEKDLNAASGGKATKKA